MAVHEITVGGAKAHRGRSKLGMVDIVPGEGINPFNYSSPVGGGELVNRHAEIKQIIDLAWSGNNTRLAAPRRFGKTSLLRAVLAEAEGQGFVVVYVDFFGVLTVEDIAERVESAYLESLKGHVAQWFTTWRRTLRPTTRLGGGPIPAQVDLSLGGTEPLIQRLNLPLRVHERSDKRVLVAFDEFQDVLLAEGADAVIRSVIQHHGGAASYVFAGSHVHMMAELFADKRRAFYAQARPVPLPPLPADKLSEYVVARFRDTGKDIGDALGLFLDAVDGHPQRAMLLANIVWERTPMGGTTTTDIGVTAYEQALASTLDESKAVWGSLSTNARRMITVIAEGRYGIYSKASGVPRGATSSRVVATLGDLGEIIEDASTVSGYRVVDPLFAAWIRAGRRAG